MGQLERRLMTSFCGSLVYKWLSRDIFEIQRECTRRSMRNLPSISWSLPRYLRLEFKLSMLEPIRFNSFDIS